MKRLDMIGGVERLLMAEGTETELGQLLYELVAVLPASNISDLIFHSDKQRTAEEILEEAIQRNRFLREFTGI